MRSPQRRYAMTGLLRSPNRTYSLQQPISEAQKRMKQMRVCDDNDGQTAGQPTCAMIENANEVTEGVLGTEAHVT